MLNFNWIAMFMDVVIPLFARVILDSTLFTDSSFVGSSVLVNSNLTVDFVVCSAILSLALAL